MPERKLLDQVSDVARLRHLSLRSEETYRSWIRTLHRSFSLMKRESKLQEALNKLCGLTFPKPAQRVEA
jgi:hypothetical protein